MNILDVPDQTVGFIEQEIADLAFVLGSMIPFRMARAFLFGGVISLSSFRSQLIRGLVLDIGFALQLIDIVFYLFLLFMITLMFHGIYFIVFLILEQKVSKGESSNL